METQPTNSVKQPAKAKPPEPPKPKLPDLPEFDWSKPVPVAVARFDRGVDTMNDGFLKSTSAKDRAARPDSDTLDIEYLAPIRHFRIVRTNKGRGTVDVKMVHESRALSWEPVL